VEDAFDLGAINPMRLFAGHSIVELRLSQKVFGQGNVPVDL
jgi:hypothetical protein